MKRYFLLILISICVIFSGCSNEKITEFNFTNSLSSLNTPSTSVANSTSATVTETPAISESEKTTTQTEIIIADQIIISVPFADQAPHKDWGEPYQEACEETSIIMAKAFIDKNNSSDLDKDYINSEILTMVDYQEKNWGGHFDLDVQMTLDLFKQYFNYADGKVISINSPDDLKQILSQGKIIIAPTYGRNLANAYFTPPGPVYHMLIIKGYDENNFITNDPGVWQGKDFTYSYENLFDSIHDLPAEAAGKKGYIKANENLMQTGEKKVIIISR